MNKKNIIIDDYALHVYAGVIISIVAGLCAHWLLDTFWSGLFGFLTGTAAGFAKEYIWDRWMKKGVFNWQDIFATFWGSLIGLFILIIIFNWG